MTREELLKVFSAYLPFDLKIQRNGEKFEEQLRGVNIHWHKDYVSTEINEYHIEDVKPLWRKRVKTLKYTKQVVESLWSADVWGIVTIQFRV